MLQNKNNYRFNKLIKSEIYGQSKSNRDQK